MKLVSTRVPKTNKLTLTKYLQSYLPSQQIRSLSKLNYKEEEIIEQCDGMRQYLLEKKLNPTNYYAVMSFLLQVEDYCNLLTYEKLTQRNVTVKRYCDEFSVKIKQKDIRGNIKLEEIVNVFDEVILSYYDVTDTEHISENIYDLIHGRDRSHQNKFSKFFGGTISKITKDEVFFSLYTKNKIPEGSKFNIKFLPSRWFIRYQHNALEVVKTKINIQELLFPIVNFNKIVTNESLELFNKSIKNNPEQLQAVMNIVDGLNGSAPYIIFGPPGTGKTTTIVESVFQLWKTKPSSRILITAGSNAACDEVAKRLCRVFEEVDKEGRNLLRIYAAAAESRVKNAEEILIEASNFCYGYHFYPSLQSISLYRILVVTLSISGKLVQANIPENYFTHIFIDECGASTEPETLVGISKLLSPKAKIILSGDPKQLGPVINSQDAAKLGLCVSMLERLLERKCYEVDKNTGEYNTSIQTRLRRNFRTHPLILNLSNRLYYNNELIPCAKSDETHWALGWSKLSSKKFPIIFHSANGRAVRDDGQTSLRNSAESEIVLYYVKSIMTEGVNGKRISEKDIGIISPYKRQCDIIGEKLSKEGWPQIEVGSVEVFQGQEKPIIIVSTVRSRTQGVGFLDSPKRINVTLTRAKALLIIIGNPETLQTVSDWREVIKYCQENKAIKGKKSLVEKLFQNPGGVLLPNVPLKSKDDLKFPNIPQSETKDNFKAKSKISSPYEEQAEFAKSNLFKNNQKQSANSKKCVEMNNLVYSINKLKITLSKNDVKMEEQLKKGEKRRPTTNTSQEARTLESYTHKGLIIANSYPKSAFEKHQNDQDNWKDQIKYIESKEQNLPLRQINAPLKLPTQIVQPIQRNNYAAPVPHKEDNYYDNSKTYPIEAKDYRDARYAYLTNCSKLSLQSKQSSCTIS